MHEYPKGHPMYRPPRYALNLADRLALGLSIRKAIAKALGKKHPQVAAFDAQAKELNADRLISVAEAYGVDVTEIKARSRHTRRSR